MSDLKRLPVFVFPSSLNFYAEDSSSHKQVVTLYNPYEYPVDFRVLSTAPWKYRIVDPEGSIKPHMCVDIVIRHNAIIPSSFHVTDKFRIQMYEYNSKQMLGKKDITVTLLPGKSSSTSDSASSQELFKQFPSDTQSSSDAVSSIQGQALTDVSSRAGRQNFVGPNYIAIAVACVCIIALMLPTTDDKGSSLWAFLHLSSHQKMVFAFTLGLVTMVILRA